MESVEKIEKQGNPENIWGIKTSKSYRNFLMAKLRHFVRHKNVECEFMIRGFIKAYDYFHGGDEFKEKNYKHEIEIVSGWKGEGSLEVYKGFDNDFRINEVIKDKYAEIVKIKHSEVKKEDLNRMIRIIKGLEVGKPIKCYEIAKRLGFEDWKSLWKERRIYFKKYYYPIKVLEALKVISYFGNGTIVRVF